MKRDEVPQDNNRTLAGSRKAVYATDEEGHYRITESSGWQVEEIVTSMAAEDFARNAAAALERARKGETSPLEYHMYRRRMDLATLSQATGLWQWRIRRHFRPAVFERLPEKLLERYADALGLSTDDLESLPDA